MEISQLPMWKGLLGSILRFLQLSSRDQTQTQCEPIQRYYHKAVEILKLLKKSLLDDDDDGAVGAEMASSEKLQMAYVIATQSIDELGEIFENWQPLMSKFYLVLQADALLTKIQTSSLEIVEQLQSDEHISEKMKSVEPEQTLEIITKAIRDRVEGSGVTSGGLAEVADCLSLTSNQELLIEAVALENLKEDLVRGERAEEADFIDQMLSLVMEMHEQLVALKQSRTFSPVPIPADFCCPLSLEVMIDPVIVESGQTYERAFIQKWLDLGLIVCPKTRQPLAHTNLIPNYTVKGWIVNWCDSNNVELPDPVESMRFNQPSSLFGCIDSSPPGDSRVSIHSRGDWPTMPDSALTLGPPLGSVGPQIEQKPSHSPTSSEGSLPGMTENGDELDPGEVSNIGRLASSEERSSGSSDEFPTLIEHRNSSQGLDRITLSSGKASLSEASEATSSNGNEASTSAAAESGNAHTVVTTQPMTVVPQREHPFPSWLEKRNLDQQKWHRPSDRLIPKIVRSMTVETRPDLPEVEVQVKNLMEELKGTSLEAQRNATSQLRFLAKHNMDNRIVIANCGAIDPLVNLLRSTDSEIQENAVTALLNLSINDNNKTAIANSGAIELLIHVLQTGSTVAKENSAATLFSISGFGDYKAKIGRAGAIRPLVNLLETGTPRGKRDATTALYNLSLLPANKSQIVEAGAVKHLVDLMDSAAGMVDKAVAVLSNLSTIDEGRQEIARGEGIPLLVEVVELGSARSKENAAAALLQLCSGNSKNCNMVLKAGAVPPLVALQHSGTPRAKEKARLILNEFKNQRYGTGGRR